MRTGNVRRLHSGCGFIAAWRADDPGWPRRGARRPTADLLFFCARDAEDFDSLHEGDRVQFETVEPEPPRGPRAFKVRRTDDDD